MRRVPFDPEKLPADLKAQWDRLMKRAEDGRAALLQAHAKGKRGTALPYNSAIWKDIKEFLLDHVFFAKCAYCECRVPRRNFNADAEHYRPRNEVTVRGADGKGQEVKIGGVEHSGYYWLAYDWRNLIPACEGCNSGAKGTLFPCTTHSMDSSLGVDALDALEDPQLLHPCRGEAPEKHLVFGVAGTVEPLTPRGAATIDTVGLKRLIEDRIEAQKDVVNHLAMAVSMTLDGRTTLAEALDRYIGPRAPFSRAVQAFVRVKLQSLLGQAGTLFDPP